MTIKVDIILVVKRVTIAYTHVFVLMWLQSNSAFKEMHFI